jgi:hypothetical protein
MKKSHFTETQILAAIQKQEKGIAIKDIVREMGVSECKLRIPPSNPCLFELSSHLFLTKKYDKASFTLKDGEDY